MFHGAALLTGHTYLTKNAAGSVSVWYVMCTLHFCLLPGPRRSHHPSNCSTAGTAAAQALPGLAPCPTLRAPKHADSGVPVLRAEAAAAASGMYSRTKSGEVALRRGWGAVAHLSKEQQQHPMRTTIMFLHRHTQCKPHIGFLVCIPSVDIQGSGVGVVRCPSEPMQAHS